MGQSTISIYGSPMTSARRCYWALEELGLSYRRLTLDVCRKEHRDASFLKLNPNGKGPCLTDGDFAIWESMAINHYLCEKYGRASDSWLGRTHEESGVIQQWSFWAISELQKPLMDMLVQMHLVPEGRRDMVLCERSKRTALPMLQILDGALADRLYLAGDRFTLADINVASVGAMNLMCGNDLSKLPRLNAWLKACIDRPAYQRVAALDEVVAQPLSKPLSKTV